MRSIGIWKHIDRKFWLRPWKCKKNITTRCGLMLSLGMGLPRKVLIENQNTCIQVYEVISKGLLINPRRQYHKTC